MSFKENEDLQRCYSPNSNHLLIKFPVLESDVCGRTSPGHEIGKVQYCNHCRSRRQSLKGSEEINICSCSHRSPKSSHQKIAFQVEGEPGLKDGERSLSRDQLRQYEISGRNLKHWAIVLLTAVTLSFSFISASLLGRFYFDKGGTSLWLYTLSQTIGFPVTGAVMVGIRLFHKLDYSLTLYALTLYIILGVVVAMDNVLYSWSVYYLPISTVGLLGATHVGFTSIFAYVLVKKKLTPFALNCVILVTFSAVILELSSGHHHSNDTHSSRKRYLIGFSMSILANLLYGLLLPLMELILQKLEHARNKREATKNTGHGQVVLAPYLEDKYLEVYIMLEMHTCSNAFASAAVFVGLMVSGEYSSLKGEMHSFDGGLWIYWLSFVCGALGWQLNAMTALAIITLTSSLFAGVLNTFNLPFIAAAAVIFFGDQFGGLTATAMLVSIWGFASYIYGGYLDSLQTCPK